MKQRPVRSTEVLQPATLLGDDETAALDQALQQLYDAGQYRAVIDLSKVENNFNSTGIGILIKWHARMINRQGHLVLTLPGERLNKFFVHSKLELALTIRAGVVEAACAAEGLDSTAT